MGGPADAKAEFLERIKPFLKPGDVVNIDTGTPWYNLDRQIALWSIRNHQRELFGVTSRWRDTHTMLYLPEGDDHKLLSVEPPRARWALLQNLYNDKISVFRYVKRDLNEVDIATMTEAADEQVGAICDVGPIVEMAVDKILEFPHTIRYGLFDFSRYCKVSAVGARVCFEYLRKILKQAGDDSMSRLFSKFKLEEWGMREQVVADNTECRGVDVEATSPAHFANSHNFENEFELIAEFDRGEQVIPAPPPPEPEPEPAADDGHHH